jgi:uncharacterized membrane protein
MIRGLVARRGVLLASLGLNVFLAFLIGSHVIRFQHYRPPNRLEKFLAKVPEKLSGEDARKFQEVIDRDRATLLGYEQAWRQAKDHVIEVLRADPFDPDAFQRSVMEAKGKRTLLENAFEKSFVEAAKKVSPQGRQRLADLRVNPG